MLEHINQNIPSTPTHTICNTHTYTRRPATIKNRVGAMGGVEWCGFRRRWDRGSTTSCSSSTSIVSGAADRWTRHGLKLLHIPQHTVQVSIFPTIINGSSEANPHQARALSHTLPTSEAAPANRVLQIAHRKAQGMLVSASAQTYHSHVCCQARQKSGMHGDIMWLYIGRLDILMFVYE